MQDDNPSKVENLRHVFRNIEKSSESEAGKQKRNKRACTSTVRYMTQKVKQRMTCRLSQPRKSLTTDTSTSNCNLEGRVSFGDPYFAEKSRISSANRSFR